MVEMLLPDVQFEVYVWTERPPAVEAKEGQLSCMQEQVMLQTDRDFENGVTLGANLQKTHKNDTLNWKVTVYFFLKIKPGFFLVRPRKKTQGEKTQ